MTLHDVKHIMKWQTKRSQLCWIIDKLLKYIKHRIKSFIREKLLEAKMDSTLQS